MDEAEKARLIGIALNKFRIDRDYEDLRQEAYIILHKAQETYAPGQIITMIRFRTIDYLRKRDGKDRQKQFLPLGDRDVVDRPELVARPSILFSLSGRSAILADMVYDGYTQEEIGKVFGVSGSRVSQLLSDLTTEIKRLETNHEG